MTKVKEGKLNTNVDENQLPEGWVETTLGEVVEFVNDKIQIEKVNLNNYISTENLLPDKLGVQKATTLPKISKVNHFKKEDTLFSNIRTYFKKVWFANFDGGASNDVLIFRPKDENILDKKFLFYSISSEVFINFTVISAKGTKMPRGDREAMKTFPINLPPLSQQKAIARMLSAFDDKIELLREQNETLEKIGQEIFKEWFGKYGIDDELPDGWRVGKLGDEFEIIMGQSPKGETYNEKSVGTVFFQGRAEFQWRFPKKRLYTTDPKRMAESGDILVSVRAPVGDINVACVDCCIGRGLAAVNSKYKSYALYKIKSLKNAFDVFESQGTVFGSINKTSFSNIEVVISDKKTIEDFERTVSRMDKKIKNNSEQIQTLSKIRDTLLPKLMKGEIILSEK